MLIIKKNLINKILIISVAIILIGILLVLNPPNIKTSVVGQAINNSDGKQLISITAKAGFTPSSISAFGNKSTILRVATKNTFDCTSTISIPKLGINKTLPFTGETDIEIPPQEIGTKLTGTCSMGMYSFIINFT